MIIRHDKSYETNSLFPNINWYKSEDNYIVDETTEEGKLLAQKVIENSPYFEFVLDNNGNLVDVIPTERPPQPVQPPTTEERLQMVEDTILFLLKGGM